jgi:RNA polymerase sigma factor (sigma-70 family)
VALAQDRDPKGPKEALEAWVLSTLPRALGYAASLLRDRGRAEDVVHDCYLRLLQRADRYDLLQDGTKLLFRAITNACVDSNYRERVFASLDPTVDEGSLALADPWSVQPLEAAAQKELEEALAAGLEELPLAQRAALELKSLGYSLQEVALALETSTSNAGVLVHRGRKALAESLARFLGPVRHE